MTTVFDLLNQAAERNKRKNQTYGSINEVLTQEKIHEDAKSIWDLSGEEGDLYHEIRNSDVDRLHRFG